MPVVSKPEGGVREGVYQEEGKCLTIVLDARRRVFLNNRSDLEATSSLRSYKRSRRTRKALNAPINTPVN